MASQWKRQWDGATLVANQKQSKEDAFDAGAYNKLQVQCRMVKVGTAGSILLEHAAVNDDGAYVVLANVSWLADGTSAPFQTVENFLRYVRVAAGSTVAGAPGPVIDIIGKE